MADERSAAAMIREIEFAPDSPLERDGFEPLVPRKRERFSRLPPARVPRPWPHNVGHLRRNRDQHSCRVLISRTSSLSVNETPAALADGDHYRDMAGRLRELARLTHSTGIRKQLAALARRYDGVAGHLDGPSQRRIKDVAARSSRTCSSLRKFLEAAPAAAPRPPACPRAGLHRRPGAIDCRRSRSGI